MAILRFDRFTFDPSDGLLRDSATGREQRLRPQLGSLLACFLSHPQEVLGRERLCQAVWGSDTVVDFESGLSALIKELRQVLGERGDGARLIETLPRRGYRLTCTVHRETLASRLRRQAPLALAGLVSILLIGGLLFSRSMAPQLGPAPEPALVVLPTQVFTQAEALPEHIEWRLADAVLTQLWQAELEGVMLIGRSSTQASAQRGNGLQDLAQRLDADLIFETSLEGTASQWQLTARLLRAPSGRVLWQQQIGPSDYPLVVGQNAERLVQSLASEWPALLADARP